MKMTRILLLFLILMMGACAPAEQDILEKIDVEAFIEESPAYLDGEWMIAKVDRVVDGDTMVISPIDVEQVTRLDVLEPTVRIRFLAIDTPENTKVKQLYGEESTAVVKHLLEGNEVVIELDPKATFDNYDRLLGHVYTVDGVNIQKLLLRNGLARVAYLFDEYKYVEEYQALEQAARSEQLHIHSIKGYVTERGFDMDVVER